MLMNAAAGDVGLALKTCEGRGLAAFVGHIFQLDVGEIGDDQCQLMPDTAGARGRNRDATRVWP